jgi:tRNA uridine 5-carboxymethylaminomethyl modification enzyme
LLLRSDNADMRLTDYGYKYGLISQKRYDEFNKKRNSINEIYKILDAKHFGETSPINEYLMSLGYERLSSGVKAKDILKRNGVSYKLLKNYLDIDPNLDIDVLGEYELEVAVKYEGYIESERKDAEKFRKLENIKLRQDIDYLNMDGLRIEARQKLDKVRPATIGQAGRISGVNPADISILVMNLRKLKEI